MMKMRIRHYGYSVLRQKAKPVEKITDEVREFVKSMIETLEAYENGIGLAANQVGILLRIFIVYPIVPNENGEYVKKPLKVFINPKLSNFSKEIVEDEEGCLSLPGVHGNVFRPTKTKIEATDLDGNQFTEEACGFYARELMHENDHLDGILFIDHLSKHQHKEVEAKLADIKKREYLFSRSFM